VRLYNKVIIIIVNKLIAAELLLLPAEKVLAMLKKAIQNGHSIWVSYAHK